MIECRGLGVGAALLVWVSCAVGQTAPAEPGARAYEAGRPNAASKDHMPQTDPLVPTPLPVEALPAPATQGVVPSHRPRHVRDYSWIFIDAPEPREIKVHDIVSIIVDEKSEVTLNSRFNRQRIATLKAELKEFIRLNDAGNLTNASHNGPAVDSNLQSRLNST